MLGRISLFFFGATLVTLPMAGVGVLTLVTGRDWGFGLQPSWLFLFLAAAFQLAASSSGTGSAKPPTQSGASNTLSREYRYPLMALPLVGLVLALSAVGIYWAPSGEAGGSAWWRFLRQVVQLLIMLGFVLWPAWWIRGRARWRFTLQMLVLGAVLQAAYGFLQQWHYFFPGSLLPILEKIFTSNPAILSGSKELYLGNTFQHLPRLRGTMCEPLYLGNYLLMVLPWLVWGRRWWRLAWPTLAVLGLLLLLTWSRGAWLGLAFQILALAVLFFLHRKRGSRLSGWFFPTRKAVWVGAVLLLLFLAGLIFSDAPIFQLPRQRLIQAFSGQDWSNLTRLYSMQAAWRAFLLSPLVGVGWGQFSYHFPLLVDPVGLQSQFSWPVVNNFPLKILCETGVVGFGVFLVLGGSLLRSAWRTVGSRIDFRAGAAVAGLMAILGVWAQLLTFSQYNLPHIWLSVGLLLAVIIDDDLPTAAAADGLGPEDRP